MTEEIYIDGTLMEREAGASAVSLVFQSPMAGSLDTIMSNRTNSVTFPLTDGNRRAIGYASEQAASTVFPHRRHTAIYKRDGVQVFKGYGILLNVKESTFDMSFAWGNVEALASLKTTKIRALQTANDYTSIPPFDGTQNPSVTYGLDRHRPCITAESVLARIEQTCGITGLTGTGSTGRFYKYVLPLTNKVGDVNTRLAQGFCACDGTTAAYEAGDTHYRFKKWPSTTTWFDVNGITNDDGMVDVSDTDSALFRLVGNLTLALTIAEQSFPASRPWAEFRVIGVKEGVETVLYHQAYGAPVWDDTEDKWHMSLPEEASVTLDTSNTNSIYFSLCDRTNAVTIQNIGIWREDGEYEDWANIYLCPAPTASEDAKYCAGVWPDYFHTFVKQYPIFSNLPDWTAAEFLKQLMLLEGVFALADTPTHITFVSYRDLYNRITQAADWTDRMLRLYPTETAYTMDNAQNNRCVYSGDDARANGSITSDDTTLDYEKDYVKSSFAASVGNEIMMYTEDDGKVSETIPAQRVLSRTTAGSGVHGAAFDGRLEWTALLAQTTYTALASVLYHPRIIKADIQCSIVDLVTLDWTRPIALRQTGHHYALRSLTSKENGTAEVELIQL